MKFANATNLNRKSGVAEGRDLQCALPTTTRPEMASAEHLGLT